MLRSLAPNAVGLAEVEPRQARRLARALGLVAVPGPATAFGRFGNAVLIPERPAVVRRVRLSPTPGRERRAVVLARWRDFAIAATHFGLDAAERERHASEVLALLRPEQRTVLCIDANEGTAAPAVRALRGELRDAAELAGEGTAPTFPATDPRLRIDFIFVSPDVAVTSCRVAAGHVASDHLPVVADVARIAVAARR